VADDSKSVGSPTEALRWLAKAGGDLAVANIVVDAPAAVNWAACFHAQQATEKALKAASHRAMSNLAGIWRDIKISAFVKRIDNRPNAPTS
jgi:hypothetical protein